MINELATADQLKWAAEEKANKDAVNQGMDGYIKQMAPGQAVPPDIVQRITNDPKFNSNPKVRQELIDLAKKHSGADVAEATQAYGPRFWDLYKRVTAQPNDPERISDPTELLKHAGPGGDLTLAGVTRLTQALQASQKSVDTHSVEQTKASLMAYAKSKLSFEQDMGPIKIRDPVGEQIFSAQFVPRFLAAFDKHMAKEGKDPWEFLTQENIDKMLTGMRDPKKMARDRLMATGGGAEQPPRQPVPPAPPGVNAETWQSLAGHPPMMADGVEWPIQNWAKTIDKLRSNPTPEAIQDFNKKFGSGGYDAEEILGRLKKPSQTDTSFVPPAAVQ
jgi:hypothetical protein